MVYRLQYKLDQGASKQMRLEFFVSKPWEELEEGGTKWFYAAEKKKAHFKRVAVVRCPPPGRGWRAGPVVLSPTAAAVAGCATWALEQFLVPAH